MVRKAVLIAIIVLFACAMSFAEGTKETAAGDEAPVKITNQMMSIKWNDYPDNPVAKEILERLNIELEAVQVIPETWAAMKASGDLPDLFITEAAERETLISAGFVLELDDLAEEYAPDLLKNMPLAIGFSKKFWSLDTGKFYAVPGGGGYEPVYYYGKGGNIALNIRFDWYKEIGAPPMRDEDSMLDAIEAMVKAHPTTADGKRVYGIPITCDWGLWAYSIPYAGILGYQTVTTWGMSVDVKTSELVDNFTNPDGSIWSMVRFFFKENQRGIFDEDSLVASWADTQAKGANEQYVGTFFGSTMDPANAILTPQGKGFIEVPMPWEGMGHWGGGDWRYGYNNARWISAKAERPDKVMEFLNFCYSFDGARITSSGAPGVHWDMEGGVPVMRQTTIDAKSKGGVDWDATGIGHIGNYGMGNIINPADGYPIDLFFSPAVFIPALNPLEKDYSKYYGVQYPAEILEKTMKEYNQYSQSLVDNRLNANMPVMPDDLKRIHSVCDNIVLKGIPPCILAKDEAEYKANQDAVFAELKKAGFDQIKEWYLKSWKEVQRIMGPKAK